MNQKLLFAFMASQAFLGANAQQFGSRTLIAPSATYVNSYVFEDIDEDGDIDIIGTRSTGSVSSSANEVFWYKNLGNETFSPRTLINSNYEDIAEVKLLDIDEDGKKDLVVGDSEIGMSWIKNLGSGFFGSKVGLPYNSYMTTFEIGDMNNDGKKDIIVAQLSGDSLHFLRNTGNGVFVFDSMFYAPGDNIYSLTFGDLDQDQVTDLIVSMGGTTVRKVIQFEYANNAFVATNLYSSTGAPYLYQSYLVDMDNDGKVDVVSNASDCGGYWFKNFGNNQYSGITPVALTGCNNYNFAGPADLDLDGFQDYVYYRYGDINYKKGTGVGELDATTLEISQSGTIVGELENTKWFDIDQDGDLDIFYSTVNEFGWFSNNASALTTPELTASAFSVYPNPAKDELNLKANFEFEAYKIFDSTGKLIDEDVLTTSASSHVIDLGKLSQGLYFVEIQSGSSREIKRFVKG